MSKYYNRKEGLEQFIYHLCHHKRKDFIEFGFPKTWGLKKGKSEKLKRGEIDG
jgi:hypothetical protein